MVEVDLASLSDSFSSRRLSSKIEALQGHLPDAHGAGVSVAEGLAVRLKLGGKASVASDVVEFQ